MNQRQTIRWSLIGLIAVLAVALTFVALNIQGGDSAEAKPKSPSDKVSSDASLQGVGWWPAREKKGQSVADPVGGHGATLIGGAGWAQGPHGSALLFDGRTGSADTGAQVLDTVNDDYTVSALVRLDADGFRTAVSLDGKDSSVFYLQYVPEGKRFAFSFANKRALAKGVPAPEFGRWYHLTGTYSHADSQLRIYVDGKAAGKITAQNPEQPTGHLVIGRGKFKGKGADFWPGAIGNVRVFARALGPAEAGRLAQQDGAQ
ncbi:LamG domain-containing protein [Streptomyces sp. NPDC048641]|uniref:LamG domain-containing protein n=1 Tax=unclassified Streptomyces TaxID=2593676 RepID=UPI00341EBC07